MAEQERLLADLKSNDWEVAVQAAEELRLHDGAPVTAALVDSLDAHNTAITAAATRSLLLRNDANAIEPLWAALNDLDDDITDHAWDEVAHTELRHTPIAEELLRRNARPA